MPYPRPHRLLLQPQCVHDCARTLTQAVSVITKPCQPDDLLRAANDILKVA